MPQQNMTALRYSNARDATFCSVAIVLTFDLSRPFAFTLFNELLDGDLVQERNHLHEAVTEYSFMITNDAYH